MLFLRRSRHEFKNSTSLNLLYITRPRTITSSLKASNFDYKNPEHVAVLRSMGINIEFVDGEKLQLVHNSGTAYSEQLGVEGVIFMKEISEHAKEMSRGKL